MAEKAQSTTVAIKPPNMDTIKLRIRNLPDSPLVVHKFSTKAKEQMMATMAAGSQARARRDRKPRDYDADFRGACYQSADGWYGFNASAIRAASISACRTVGFKMTHAKLGVFVVADGMDAQDGTPLVKITKGKPKRWDSPARNDNGSVDIRVRPRWDEWEAVLQVRFDKDMFSESDVVNLISRVGLQVGICEGRPDSKNSAGMGFGLFEITNPDAN